MRINLTHRYAPDPETLPPEADEVVTAPLVPLAREILHGEVIGPGDGVTVSGISHPLHERDIGPLTLPAGLTVAELLDEALAHATRPRTGFHRYFLVVVNGDPILRENWRKVRPKPGTTMVFRAIVEGGNGRLIASVAVAVAALATVVLGPEFAPAFFASLGAALSVSASAAAALVGGAISIGGALPATALFPVLPPSRAAP